MSTGVHPHLHFTFMSRARGRAQSRTGKGSWSLEATRCLQLQLLLLGCCLGCLAVGCSSLGSLRGTCECKKHIFKQVDLSARLCRLGSSKTPSQVLS